MKKQTDSLRDLSQGAQGAVSWALSWMSFRSRWLREDLVTGG